jgi:uncharacterized protein YdcH (DUF465 family)
MSAPHELAQDFPAQIDRIHALRETDAHFRGLTDRYHATNRAVHRAEERIEPVSDAEETRLRRERMALKDEIARYLTADGKP